MLEELIFKEDRALFSNATARTKPTAICHLAAGLTTNQRHCYDSHVKKCHIYVCNALCQYFYQLEQQKFQMQGQMCLNSTGRGCGDRLAPEKGLCRAPPPSCIIRPGEQNE